MQLAQRRDATINIRIAEDDVLAEISIHKAQGGKAVSVGDLTQALAQAGVVFGIDDAALLQVAERIDCTGVPIARGTVPQHGRDAVFKELVVHAIDDDSADDLTGLRMERKIAEAFEVRA